MQPPVQGKGTVCFPSRKPRIFLVAVGDRWLSLSPSSAFQCLLCRLRFRGSGFCGRRRTLTAPPVGQGGGPGPVPWLCWPLARGLPTLHGLAECHLGQQSPWCAISGSDLQAHPAQDAGAQNGKKKGKGRRGLDAGACWQGDQRGFVGRLRGDAGCRWDTAGTDLRVGHLLKPCPGGVLWSRGVSLYPRTLIAVWGSGAPLGTASSFL